ncbi:MAG: extracellular solute-binding protein [Oscillibacter sp.]|nr:extracellular solute-binding protein [Oscillibacter sp.]
MQQRQHMMAALLALCLLLTACGGKQQSGDPARLSGTAAYTSDMVPLDLPVTRLTASGADGGSLYLAGMEEEPAEEDGGELTSSFSYSSTTSDNDGDFAFYSGGAEKAVLYRMDAATGELVKLEGYAPGDGASVTAIVPCGDGSLWVLETTRGGLDGLDLTEVGSEGNIVFNMGGFGPDGQVWRRLDAAGAQELDRVDVTELAGRLGADTVTDTRMDREGRLYAASGSTVTVLDTGLSALFACKGQEPVEKLISLAGGGVGAVTSSGESRTVFPVDFEGRTLGGARPLTGSADQICGGNEKYDFLYTSGDSLYGWSVEHAAPEKVLSWSGAGVDKRLVEALCLLPDGQGAAVLRDGSVWLASYSMARLSPAGEDALAGRTALTLATMGLDSETRARVLEFNRTSGTHRIEIRDYSEYNTPGDASAGLSKLNTEILAGNMPDLLDVSGGIPLRRYAARGLLEDLWPFIQSDPDLGREGVMERVLQAAETGGRLYRVFPRFTIETAAGAPSAVGDKMGWTLDGLRAALEKMPAGCSVLNAGETSISLLETMFADRLDRFVDWETGTAGFDSAEFRAILEFCASFPNQAQDQNSEDSDAYTRVASGEQLLLPVYLGDLTSIQLYRALFGGAVTFVGYPGEGGAVRFQAEGGLAMSASCRDKEGAWTFLRQALLPEGKQFMAYTADFAVNRADFEREAQESMAFSYVRDENGNTIMGPDGEPLLEGSAYVFAGGQAILLKPATQADYDQVMALYEAAEGMNGRDENIWAIVQECAGAFFAGDRTAEEAAGAIQNRVVLYLNEQR